MLQTVQTALARVGPALHALIGSRFFTALSGLSFVAFLAHVVYFPQRFPPLAPMSWSLWGLAPAPPQIQELPPEARAQAREFAAVGFEYAPVVGKWALETLSVAFFGGDEGATVSALNHLGLGAWSILLCVSVYLLATKKAAAE